jgi:hypothetical protein
MQQALDQAEKVRREVEQLSRAQSSRNGNQSGQGQQPGQQQGGQQSAQNGQKGGQQPGGQQGQGQQGQGQQGQGQQGQGQQGQGQQGQGQGGQQAAGGTSPQGSPGNQGGGNGRNMATGPRQGGNNAGAMNGGGALVGPGWQGDNRRIDQPIAGNLPTGQVPPGPAQAEAVYGDLMRDLARLRGSVADDKDAARQYQELVRQAQQLDPKRWATNGQLSEVIGAQLTNALDEVELMIRRKMDASDGSVRSTNPRNTPPGYADAYSKYTKSLSKQ